VVVESRYHLVWSNALTFHELFVLGDR
jgi:hypothetical protein